MKCPKCGYVSFPHLPECRKCGHPFIQSGGQKDSRPSFPPSSNEPAPFAPPASAYLDEPQPASSSQDIATGFLAGGLPLAETTQPHPSSRRQQESENTESGWASELSKRVASYRRHRKGGRETEDRETSLQFDFDAAEGNEPRSVFGAGPEPPQNILDRAFEARLSPGKRPNLESTRLERHLERKPDKDLSSTLSGRSEKVLEDFPPQPRSHPLEFIEGVHGASSDEDAFHEIIAAPLGRRFLAGILDTAILLIAGCLFGVVFTLAGGKLQFASLDLAIVGLITIFWIFCYFGMFTSLSVSTPGQSLMGLIVLNLDGDPPTRQEAFLRAFGYLISFMALMLGFLWTAMDSDGMAWHDHISGTILVEQD